MPSLFTFRGYTIFFWASDGEEPIHVHVSLGAPSPVSAKFWLTEKGETVLAGNAPGFSEKEIRRLSRVVTKNFSQICKQWELMFGVSPDFWRQ